MARGKLIIISAPSGTGKSTIISWLMREHKELNLAYSISCTSRAPRGTEKNGVDYFFLHQKSSASVLITMSSWSMKKYIPIAFTAH